MSTSELADSPARQRFIKELDRNFCVSASAGAGKTTAIVDRIAALAQADVTNTQLGKPTHLSKLIVVTYGVLAAEELRIRARQKILQTMSSSTVQPAQLLVDFNQVFFGTIHSFCLKLIKEEGHHLGIASTVKLLEVGDETLWQRFIETDFCMGFGGAEDFITPVLRHYTFENLLKMAQAMNQEVAQNVITQKPTGPAPQIDFTQACSIVNARAKTLKELQDNLRRWQKLFQETDEFLPFEIIKNGGEEFKDAYKEACAPFLSWLNERAVFLAAQIALNYSSYRQEEGYLTYDDMVSLAKQLLRKPEILRRLRAQKYSIILDEAQDTDSAMFEVLFELTRDAKANLGDWPQGSQALGPEAGRFSFVGDDQQAIYGSRADVVHYHKYLKAFREGKGGESIEFHVTMRCPKAVIGQVNEIFPRLKQDLVQFRSLTARPGAGEGKVVWLDLKPNESKKVDELFEDECKQVVSWLVQQRREGLGVSRWSEVAILAPRKKWLEIVARILTENHLPNKLLSSNQVCADFPAYTWPVAIIQVLTQPHDRFELIGVLREIFGLSDALILEVHRESGGLDLFSEVAIRNDLTAEAKEKRLLFQHALQLLQTLQRELNESRHHKQFSLAGFLEIVVDRLELKARIRAVGEDSEPLSYLLIKAELAQVEGLTIAEWLKELKELLKKNPLPTNEKTEKIELLTSQKSKGLEWPVVIALGLGRPIGEYRDNYPKIHYRGGKFRAHLNSLTSDTEAEELEKNKTQQEHQRFFYVQLTRAKKILVLVDSYDFYKSNVHSFTDVCDLKHATKHLNAGPLLAPDPELLPDLVRIWDECEPQHKENARKNLEAMPQRILPHELALKDEGRVDALVQNFSGTGGIEYGTWWHSVLENYPWLASASEQESALALGLDELVGAPELRLRGLNELESWQKSDARKMMVVEYKLFLTEIPFIWPQSDQAWMEGVVDLILVGRDGSLAVLDWKTNRLFHQENSQQHEKRLLDTYRNQLCAYSEMLAQISGRKVSQVWLYATATGKLIEV